MRTSTGLARGFTLIETIVSIVVFGVLMTLVTGIFAPAVVRATDPLHSMRAAELGQSYIEEMLGKRFDENSPQGNSRRCNAAGQPACSAALGRDDEGASHAGFDDFDDYHGFSDGSATTAPTNQNNTPRANYTGFVVTATVVYAGSEVGLPNNSDAKRVDLTVTDPRGGRYVFSAYKTNF